MKLLVFLLLLWGTPEYQLEVVTSEPHGVFYLLECLRGDAHRSRHLPGVFRAAGWTEADQRALDGYATLVERSSWNTLRLPGDGEKRRKLADVLEGVSLQSSSAEDFLVRSRPLLSTRDHAALATAVRHFAPLYRERVWQPCLPGLQEQQRQLEEELRRRETPRRLRQAARLYGSTWPPEQPFVAALTPIPRKPGEKLESFGHSDGYLEVVEAPQHAPLGHAAGVIFHELCHSLWSNSEVARLKGACSAAAWDQLNEGLATALGNGWFQSLPEGNLSEGPWYNDDIIAGYARVLHPLVLPYLEAEKPLDEEFARAADASFQAAFPRADSDVLVMLRNVLFISENSQVHEGGFQTRAARMGPMRSLYVATPLASPESLERFARFEGAVVFMITPEQLPLLAGYGWSSRQLELARLASASGLPLGLARKTARGWQILALGRDLAGQEEALQKVLQGRWLADSFD